MLFLHALNAALALRRRCAAYGFSIPKASLTAPQLGGASPLGGPSTIALPLRLLLLWIWSLDLLWVINGALQLKNEGSFFMREHACPVMRCMVMTAIRLGPVRLVYCSFVLRRTFQLALIVKWQELHRRYCTPFF